MAVILSAGGSFACFYIALKLPMTISIYLALPFALPFALAGFMRIHGMSPFDYLKKKKKVVNSAILTRRPSYVVDAEQIMGEIYQQRAREKADASSIGKKILLQTEDEIFIRTKEFERIHKFVPEASSVTTEKSEQKGVSAAIESEENNEGI